MKKRVVIVGLRLDGQAGVVLPHILQNSFYELVGFVDDNRQLHGTSVQGYQVLGGVDDMPVQTERRPLHAVVAIGNNADRRSVSKRLEHKGIVLLNILDPSASIADTSIMGRGNYIGPHAVIHNYTRVGNGVVVNTAATVDHNCHIRDYVNIAPGCHLGGRVVVEECAFIGIGATIVPDVVIGANAVVGAGAVVLHSVPADTRVAGVPAKPF